MTIPIKIRNELAEDEKMKHCVYKRENAPNHNCRGRITFEHAFKYRGCQIQEVWAIIGCCKAHNSGEAMDKRYNEYCALLKAKETVGIHEVCKKYPKFNWCQLFTYLTGIYGEKET